MIMNVFLAVVDLLAVEEIIRVETHSDDLDKNTHIQCLP